MNETQVDAHQTWSIDSLDPELDVWTLRFLKNHPAKISMQDLYFIPTFRGPKFRRRKYGERGV